MSKFLELALSINSVSVPEFPEELSSLINLFDENLEDIKKNQVEASTRVDFINPLLELLGWDVQNKSGALHTKRDVTYEPAQRVDGNLKAPDYALCVEGKRKIFVEAKRPSQNLETNKAPAYQLRKYSWSASLPFGVLTDFEEFAIYNTSYAPMPGDDADVGRVAYFNYKSLKEFWPGLYSMLSREAVSLGSLEILAERSDSIKGQKTLDVAFLDLMKVWRLKLTQSMANLNLELDPKKLDFESQALINKIVFLRMLEDRGLEVDDGLLQLAERTERFNDFLISYFERADDRYNSGLFSGSGLGSSLSRTYAEPVKVGEQEIKGFIRALYFPSPFEFSVLPLDVLGRIYELLLAEEVSFSDASSRTVMIELKPEVRKKGGVFYTPVPIVNYIVEETVGPLIKGMGYSEILKIKIVDPAAGSGSFLVAVFQFLIDYVTDQQAKLKTSKHLEYGLNGQLRLSTAERKKLLLNCIYGVDIDAQAVAVCKLSLLLMLVENDAQQQFDIGHILPNLQDNVLSGNSLIGDDFDSALIEHELDSVFNPFNWSTSFPEVFKQGGFDAVVGNPPYLNIDATWGQKDPRLGYIKSHYPHIHTDKTDLLYYFLEKGSSICKGELGFIVSRSFLEADKAQKLRSWLSDNTRVREVLDFRDALVFPGVGINTAIVRLTKSLAVKKTIFRRWESPALPAGYSPRSLKDPANFQKVSVPKSDLTSGVWNFGEESTRSLIAKMDNKAKPWSLFAEVGKGMETGANKAFEVDREFVRNNPELASFVFPRAANSQISRYSITEPKTFMLYLGGFSEFSKLPKALQSHLESHRETLKGRAAFKRGNCEWWQFTWPLHQELFRLPKIVSPYMAHQTTFAPDFSVSNFYSTDTTVLYLTKESFPKYALLALLNSDIANFRFEYITKLKGGGQREYFAKQVLRFPVPFFDNSDPKVVELEEIGKQLCELGTVLHSTLLADEVAENIKSRELLRQRVEKIVARLYALDASDVELVGEYQREATKRQR